MNHTTCSPMSSFQRQDFPDDCGRRQRYKQTFWKSRSIWQSRHHPSVTALSLQERLAFSIRSVQVDCSQTNEVGDPAKKEFDHFERHRICGPIFNKLFNALRSVQPTMTQKKRNFSLVAGIAMKTRSIMFSKKLNAICFLKSYLLAMKTTK